VLKTNDMLKFIKHHLEGIENVEVYPIIALLIFVLFFTGLLIYVFKSDHKYINMMKQMPLDLDEENGQKNSNKNE